MCDIIAAINVFISIFQYYMSEDEVEACITQRQQQEKTIQSKMYNFEEMSLVLHFAAFNCSMSVVWLSIRVLILFLFKLSFNVFILFR